MCKRICLYISLLFLAFGGTTNAVEMIRKEKKLETPTGEENLVIIQSVSTTQKTFVVRRGRRDGISPRQKALFSTTEVSILCKAVEVSHSYSLWKVADERATIPFNKRQYVVFSTSLDSIWQKIPNLKESLKMYLASLKDVPKPYYTIRTGFSASLYESTSEVTSNRSSGRTGLNFEGLYNKPWFPRLDIGFGVRIDVETATIESPALNIPTNRYMAISELIYHFPDFKGSRNHFYGSVGVGYGLSTTTISDATSVGSAILLPSFKLGLETSFVGKNKLIVELAGEAIGMNEAFQDGTEQDTNVINGKINIGIRF